MTASVMVLAGSLAEKRSETDIVFAKNYRAIFSYCRQMLRDKSAAEDATQETFLRAWKSGEQFHGDSAIRTWLHSIARNVCLSEIRGSGLKHPEQFEETESGMRLEDLIPSKGPCPLSQFSHEEFYGEFKICLSKLGPKYRTVIYAIDVMEEKHAIVARDLQLPTNTVKTQVLRARDALRNRLRRVGYGSPRDLL